ncbi:MAG: DUF1329 domain-containing protein [Pseudomonadota bacterium]
MMSIVKSISMGFLILLFAGTAIGGVTKEEVAQLGKTLTAMGAEKAGNADGTIPAYTGGLVTGNAEVGPVVKNNPYADEKPLFSITVKNMAQYADKLSEGVKARMQQYPDTYRMDVYKTHRTAAFPEWVNEATIKNAGKAETVNEGYGIKNAHAFTPFPIPKTGAEAMWNKLTVYTANQKINFGNAYLVDGNGRALLSSRGLVIQEFPYWDRSKDSSDFFFMLKRMWDAPARRSGEGLMLMEPLNFMENPRRAWQYLPGQRRVKVSPDVNYDTPDPAFSGASTFDDNLIFNGPMDRYTWKLTGKKEMYVAYNNFKMAWYTTAEDLFQPGHINPDVVRWELHRVWVVEATLRPDKRHIYHKRVFYLDEDSWNALLSDQYDAQGKIYRAGVMYMLPLTCVPVPDYLLLGHYDFVTRQYTLSGRSAVGEDKWDSIAPLPPNEWSPDTLAGSGIR